MPQQYNIITKLQEMLNVRVRRFLKRMYHKYNFVDRCTRDKRPIRTRGHVSGSCLITQHSQSSDGVQLSSGGRQRRRGQRRIRIQQRPRRGQRQQRRQRGQPGRDGSG